MMLNAQPRNDYQQRFKSLQERFEEKFSRTGDCWLWQAAKDGKGYGLIKVNGRMLKAPRVSYELYIGKIPRGAGYHGTCVLHKCDVPSCVNPEHLFLGTQKDNSADCLAKGRHTRLVGEKNGSCKLTRQQVLEIRERYSGGEGTKALEEVFRLSHSHIHQIVTRKRWGHL